MCYDDIVMRTVTLKETREAQGLLGHLEYHLRDLRDELAWKSRNVLGFKYEDTLKDDEVKKLLARIAEVKATVDAGQAQHGGVVFRVADQNLATLEDKVAKLNRRAEKLGIKGITLTVTDETEIEKRLREGYDPAVHEASEWTFLVRFTYVVLDGQAVRLDGWRFLAALDHETGTDTVGVHRTALATANDLLINLDDYRHADNVCEHCGFTRDRKKTYVLAHDSGEIKQVGSTCVQDFLGGDAERIARLAEYFAEFLGYAGGEAEEFSASGHVETLTLTEDFVSACATLIRLEGWKGRGQHGPNSTADRADQGLNGRGKGDREILKDKNEGDTETAKAALTWLHEDLAKRENLSEFESNVVAYASGEVVTRKGLGTVAYLTQLHQRHLEGEVKRQIAAKQNEAAADSAHIANVGDRVKLTFTVIFSRSFDGYYGVRYLTKGLTPDGNLITWWGSGAAASEVEVGQVLSCTATIKAHGTDEYSGGANTTEVKNVRSVKVLDEAPDGDEIEVQKTAEQREIEREAAEERKRDKEEEKRRQIEREVAVEADELEEEVEGLRLDIIQQEISNLEYLAGLKPEHVGLHAAAKAKLLLPVYRAELARRDALVASA